MGTKPKIPLEKPPQEEVRSPETVEARSGLLLEEKPAQPEKTGRPVDRGSQVGGSILIVLGLLFLAKNLIPRFSLSDYWPLILIAIGAGLLWKAGGR